MQTYATRDTPVHAANAREADSLRFTVRGILRSWWIVVLAAVVAAGAAIAYSETRPASYQSSASLLFNDAAYQQAVAGGYSPVDAQRRLRTSADVLRLPAVAEQARNAVRNRPGVHPGTTKVKTQFSLDSNTMRVVATGSDPRSPAYLANATADAFLAYRKDMSARSLDEARRVLREQISNAPTKGERRALVAKRNNLDAMKAIDDQGIQISQRATVPATVTSKDTRRNALIALVLGALVGVAISLLRVPKPAPPLHDPWIEAERSSSHPS
jgi:capsular polysaccharide biosynthesis protein